MEFKLVYIRRTKYLLLYVFLRRFSTAGQSARAFGFPFPRERKMLEKKKIALMIVSILNGDSR